MPTYTPQGQNYGYEWMNATQQTADLLDQIFPVIQEYADAFGLMPKPEPQPQTVVVQPKPWYEDLPPWVWGAAAVVGVVLVVKLLEG